MENTPPTAESTNQSYFGDLSLLPPAQIRALKHACENDLLTFTKVLFKFRFKQRFRLNWHHELITSTLMDVINHRITRLIINMPPRYSKTEIAVNHFIAYGLALNPQSRFIHASYSDDLALRNSGAVKDIIQLPEYQTMWPRKIRDDAKSKKQWYTHQQGGLLAVPTGGQITGFGAGRMAPGFQGALVIDDPIKPEDATSPTIREKMNTRFVSTLRNRLDKEDTPIIVIMQRLHEVDLSGFLLQGGSGEEWHHLELPVEVQPDRPYPDEYTHGIQIPTNAPLPEGSPLWFIKHDASQIETLKSNPYDYSTQYDQRPSPLGGSIFKEEWLHYYDHFDAEQNLVVRQDESTTPLFYKHIYADTAMKTGQHNDFSVFQLWGYGKDSRLYLLDQIRGKWEAPELEQQFQAFLHKHRYNPPQNMMGVRRVAVEDKASGTGLIQSLGRKANVPITPIPRDKDKVSRAQSAATIVSDGRLFLPRYAPWLPQFIHEYNMFNARMTHAHDDQLDPMMDAIHDLILSAAAWDYRNVV
jgi:predicted phage terminase large subunit-like protein